MNWPGVAEGLCAFQVRAAKLGFLGVGIAFVLSGGSFGGAGLSLLCGLFTAFVAATLNVIFSAMIGLSAFVIEDTGPVYWLWQKVGFAFGGLMFPLDLYPDTMQHIAGATPFPSLLEAPERVGFGTGSGFVLVGWLAIALLSTHLTFRQGLESVRHGGS